MSFCSRAIVVCILLHLIPTPVAGAARDAALSTFVEPGQVLVHAQILRNSSVFPTFRLSDACLVLINKNGSLLADRLREEFAQCANDAGLDTAGFTDETWRALIFSFEIILENLLQHEYSNERNIHVLYRVFSEHKRVVIEFLGRGDSEKFYHYIIPGKAYSVSDAPWTSEYAPLSARDVHRTNGAGKGLSYLFMRFGLIASHYWDDIFPDKKREITISWDYNTTGVKVPGAKDTSHVIRLTVPLMKKASPAKRIMPYPHTKKQYLKAIRRYLHTEQALISGTVMERLAARSKDDAERVENGQISLDYAYILSRVLSAVFRLSYYDPTGTSFVPQAVTRTESGTVHCVVVFYYKGRPVLLIDPCYYKFDPARKGKIIVSGYNLPQLGYTNTVSEDPIEVRKMRWAKEVFKKNRSALKNNQKYFFTWRSIIKEIVTETRGLIFDEADTLMSA